METIKDNTEKFDTHASERLAHRNKLKTGLGAALGLIGSNDGPRQNCLVPLSRADKVRQALTCLDKILATGRQLEACDQAWLGALRQVFAVSSLMVPEDGSGETEPRTTDLLSVESLTSSRNLRTHLEALADTLNARLSAEEYEVHLKRVGAIDVTCHNRDIADRLRADYSLADLAELVNFALDRGVFDIEIHPTTGLVRTCGSAENWDMFARQWATDTTRADELEQAVAPELWRQAMLTLARFYNMPREAAAFELYIKYPVLYRQGGPNAGVAHIFVPETLERDPGWFNNKRLESLGLALQRFCLTLAAGLVYAEPWGFTAEEIETDGGKNLDTMVRAIACVGSYLKSINAAQPEHIEAIFKLDKAKMEPEALSCVTAFQEAVLAMVPEDERAAVTFDGRDLADLVGAYLSLVRVSGSKDIDKMLNGEGWAVDDFVSAYRKASGSFKGEDVCAGFIHDDASFRAIAESIARLTAYLEKSCETVQGSEEVFDFAAPSAGPWEEMPFPGGLTGDTEIVRRGFECLHWLVSLFASPELAHTPAIAAIKERMLGTAHGTWLLGESGTAVLENLMKAGRARVIERLLGSSNPMEHPNRPADSSLAFVSTSTIRLADDILADVAAHYKVLQYVEDELVREHGMIRYAPFQMGIAISPDSYLGANYWVIPSLRLLLNTGVAAENARSFGSKDCSSEEELLARASICVADTEAEWGWVSVAADAYSRQVAKLLEHVRSRGSKPGESELQLIDHGHRKATEMLNRSYARITGERPDGTPWAKSNGKDCPPFALPEAYEYVTPISSRGLGRRSMKALPGADTPLAWMQSSLWGATRIYCQNLKSLVHLAAEQPSNKESEAA